MVNSVAFRVENVGLQNVVVFSETFPPLILGTACYPHHSYCKGSINAGLLGLENLPRHIYCKSALLDLGEQSAVAAPTVTHPCEDTRGNLFIHLSTHWSLLTPVLFCVLVTKQWLGHTVSPSQTYRWFLLGSTIVSMKAQWLSPKSWVGPGAFRFKSIFLISEVEGALDLSKCLVWGLLRPLSCAYEGCLCLFLYINDSPHEWASELLEGLDQPTSHLQNFWFIDLEWDPKICILDKFPGDAASGLEYRSLAYKGLITKDTPPCLELPEQVWSFPVINR